MPDDPYIALLPRGKRSVGRETPRVRSVIEMRSFGVCRL